MVKDVDIIKSKLDLVEFLRSYLTLTPAGRNFKAICPFHQEKTPSFVISPDRQIWHCFGCGAGGDAIGFAMRYENLEFPEALRFLAERAGVSIQTLDPREQREFGILYDLQDAAKNFYKNELSKNLAAKDYLKSRGLNEKTIDEFDLGFAPVGETLSVNLMKAGYDIADISRAGLAHKNTSGLYRDRFQERIIFPISNNVGKVVAFTGRLFGSAEENSDRPKYLNSPETPIFNKSKVLYGLNKSKQEIGAKREVLFVEGQMDFLMAWQTGVKNAVAVSGTGLTVYHLEKLRRLADTALLSFDNDEAGIKAVERSLDVFGNFDFYLKAVDLGGFKDPAEAGEKNPEFLVKSIKEARPAFERLFDYYFLAKKSDILGIAEKKRAVRHLLGKLRVIKSAVEQSEWLKELARYSGVSETALVNELENLPPEKSAKENENTQAEPAPEVTGREDLILNRLFALAFTRPDFWDILKNRKNLLPEAYEAVLQNPKSDLASALEMRGSYLIGTADEVSIKKEFGELLRQLELVSLRRQQAGFKEKIRLAEQKNEEEEMFSHIQEFHLLSKKIDELNH